MNLWKYTFREITKASGEYYVYHIEDSFEFITTTEIDGKLYGVFRSPL